MHSNIKIHPADSFEGMRKAGRLAAEVLDYIADYVKPGVSTLKLDELCHEMIVSRGAIAAPLGYRGYPKSICTSVNHVVCHGIPSADKKLKNGDILNIDVSVILDGWFGDTSRMYYVGDKIPVRASRLSRITYECLMKATEIIAPGVPFNEIGRAIEEHANAHGYSVVRDFCGHGIGRVFHDEPNVLHYYDPNFDIEMKEGMFFTIEPMINGGSYETKMLADGWTAVTRDKSLSAQFEHTIGVTKDGYEIFTVSPKGLHQPGEPL